jgi:glycosyltransferase involved in cell wall biosynthesis
MIKLAFGSVPKDGGTFTFYRNMRPALLERGIDLRCVSLGKAQAQLWEDAYANQGCVLLAAKSRSIKKQAMAFAHWCESEQIDIVMGINSEAILSALPHLPQRIRCMARCANSFDHGYRITLSGYERLAAIIAQTPRQLKDLTQTYGADPNKITVIPNGIDGSVFKQRTQAQALGTPALLRLGFLGRLEHKQKGVLFLPEIVRELNRLKVPYQLRIAGKGKHEAELRTELQATQHGAQPSSTIQMIGAIPPSEVPGFLEQTDIFLFPSQFEGCPNALLEAMMAGCVPVSWRLQGITDFIIDQAESGFLCELGDCRGFAEHIASLATDSEWLHRCSENAQIRSNERFNTQGAADRYAALIHSVMQNPAPRWQATSWKNFQADPNFEHSWKDWIPARIKRVLKNVIAIAIKPN